MWRTVLAVVAICLNALVVLFVGLAGLGVVVILSRHAPVSQALIVGMTAFGFAGLVAVVSIVAIAVRMGRGAPASSGLVASEFS